MIRMYMGEGIMRRSALGRNKNTLLFAGVSILVLLGALSILTAVQMKPVDGALRDIAAQEQSVRVSDRNGIPLSVTYQSRWNSHDHAALYDIPDMLKAAFLYSEDRRFYNHYGVDWRARLGAVRQNITVLRAVRGASTITEQVVRMINQRPRSVWSRWLEGFEAGMLEQEVSKGDIFEFYLNQVPYASNRRGVVQAARHYFNRDLSTLTLKEMLALAVLVRAPSGYDLYKNPERIEAPIIRLARSMQEAGLIEPQDFQEIKNEKLDLTRALPPVEARHFGRYVRLSTSRGETLRTTLDSSLQVKVQEIIDARVKALSNMNVHNAAAIVADHNTGEVLAWVVAGAQGQDGKIFSAIEIDTVTTPRQPGSSMKPFLYGLALDHGWTAAKILDDSPLAEAIGQGLHNFRNYSNTYYGPISLREALGNSLNIPAILTIRHVGPGEYLSLLQRLGFQSLTQSTEVYDEGLALGNGEVTLLEIAQAYAALANRGTYRPLQVLMQPDGDLRAVRVYSEEAASLIGNILSDPWARRLEFGAGSVLNLPIQTAAKTGTSTDYRDAWTLAYNDRYVVGIWMGNLDRTSMKGVTGSTGPALALRSIFSILNAGRQTAPLYFSPRLVREDVCIRPAEAFDPCSMRTEWFTPETVPNFEELSVAKTDILELVRPTEGLQIAYDPHIPTSHQKFRFELKGLEEGQSVQWRLNGEIYAQGQNNYVLWPVEKGKYTLSVRVSGGDSTMEMEPVKFVVK